MATGGWVLEENLRVFLESVAGWANYLFDESDWDAIAAQLDKREPDGSKSAEYEFGSELSLRFTAEGSGDGVVGFEIEAPRDIELRIEGAADVL